MASISASLNHIHIVADDKYKLAEWYRENLGFQVIDDIEKLGEKEGPLFISGDGGKSGLSIFSRKPRHKSIGVTVTPAFDLSIDDFIAFYRKMAQTYEVVMYDHLIFYSFYIKDPTDSTIEITNMKYQEMRSRLKSENIPTVAMNPKAEP